MQIILLNTLCQSLFLTVVMAELVWCITALKITCCTNFQCKNKIKCTILMHSTKVEQERLILTMATICLGSFVNPRLIKFFSFWLNSDFKKGHCVDIRTLRHNTCIRIDTL
jgi:uncharacterized membrane protein YwzB